MPRIYVACLAAYNAGRLHGAWIDLDESSDVDDVRDQIGAMLERSPIAGAEEYAIHDHEGFGDLIGEYEDIEHVVSLARALAEHGDPYRAYAHNVGVEYATPENFEDRYCGEWDSEEEFAQDLADQIQPWTSDSPEARAVESWPYSYIDWQRATRDLFMGDYSSSRSPRGVYVFRDN